MSDHTRGLRKDLGSKIHAQSRFTLSNWDAAEDLIEAYARRDEARAKLRDFSGWRTTPELGAPLERAQELGGPIMDVDDRDAQLTGPMDSWTVTPGPRDHRHHPASDALLINAFTLEAEQRGWEPMMPRYSEGWAVEILSSGQVEDRVDTFLA